MQYEYYIKDYQDHIYLVFRVFCTCCHPRHGFDDAHNPDWNHGTFLEIGPGGGRVDLLVYNEQGDEDRFMGARLGC